MPTILKATAALLGSREATIFVSEALLVGSTYLRRHPDSTIGDLGKAGLL